MLIFLTFKLFGAPIFSCHKDTKLILNKRILPQLFLLKNVNEFFFTKVPRETSEGYTPLYPPLSAPLALPPFQSLPDSRQFAEFPEKNFCNLMKSALPKIGFSKKKFWKNFLCFFKFDFIKKKILEKNSF